MSVAFAPNDKAVLTGSYDSTARLWDVTTGRLIGSPLRHGGPVWAVAFGPDGETFLTGSEDRTASLWHVAIRPLIMIMPHADSVKAVAFSPDDGKTLVTGSEDHTARLWNAASGRLIRELLPQEGEGGVMSVAFGREGKAVLTGSYDNLHKGTAQSGTQPPDIPSPIS